MDDNEPTPVSLTRESFAATIHFGLLALAMLFVAGIMAHSLSTVCWTIAATAFAYVGQLCYTQAFTKTGMLFQLWSLITAIIAFVLLVFS